MNNTKFYAIISDYLDVHQPSLGKISSNNADIFLYYENFNNILKQRNYENTYHWTWKMWFLTKRKNS